MRVMAGLLLIVASGCGEPDPVELDPTSDPTVPVEPTGPTEPTEPTVTDPTIPADCIPNEQAFLDNALPAIEANCAQCHGPTPDFGAPNTLTDYAGLIAGTAPDRLVDVMLDRLIDGSMPPATQGLMPHTDLDTLVAWVSCGAIHPDPADGLEASRPVWEAPKNAPAGTEIINLSANEDFVDVDDIDDYRYYTFFNVTDEVVFIRRIEAVIDVSEVVHHITLNELPSLNYLYAWAPGTGAIEFPDGGIRLRPLDTLIMNIHYNNGAGIPDVYDSSGIRLYVDEPVGTEWSMAAPSNYDLTIPANSIGAQNVDSCTVGQDFEIIAGMPHMHELGTDFKQVLERQDGTEETLIELSGWSFEAQYFYEMPTQVYAGDTLTLTCTYDNPGNETIYWGEGTGDEMCFNFMYVTPPSAAYQCAF